MSQTINNNNLELEWYNNEIKTTYSKLIKAKKILTLSIKDYINNAMKNTEIAYNMTKEKDKIKQLELLKLFKQDTKALNVYYLSMVDAKTKVLLYLDTLDSLRKERKIIYENITREQN